MKGQLTLEFFITMIFFVIFVFYIYQKFATNIPIFIDEIKKEDIRSKAFQISEVLINDPGHPADWTLGNVERVGLSDENYNKTNLISIDKIADLDDICSGMGGHDYGDLQDYLAIYEPFSIYIFDIDQSTGARAELGSCEPPQGTYRIMNATVRRITAYSDAFGITGLAEVIVQV